MKQIILASTSIYRKQQLERLNISFLALSPNVDEEALKIEMPNPVHLSRELALLKARNISSLYDDAVVIGGDQVATIDQAILSKPGTKERAFEQLQSLAGKEHELVTSVAIIADGQEYINTSIAKMKMRQLTGEQIARYINNDAPLYSCGSYRLEALGISLFEHIECDDYTAIIGIPLMWTARTLSKIGVPVP